MRGVRHDSGAPIFALNFCTKSKNGYIRNELSTRFAKREKLVYGETDQGETKRTVHIVYCAVDGYTVKEEENDTEVMNGCIRNTQCGCRMCLEKL